jgi:hypothetical protein
MGRFSNGLSLYGKIGCMERETFTSTKLQLRLYTDAQCSRPYEDGESSQRHARKGYQVGDTLISAQVSFKVPFYSCASCAPEQVSGTFNKRNGNWYDDDYISTYGMKQGDYGNNNKYSASNDDVNGHNRRQLHEPAQRQRFLTASDVAPRVRCYVTDFTVATECGSFVAMLFIRWSFFLDLLFGMPVPS